MEAQLFLWEEMSHIKEIAPLLSHLVVSPFAGIAYQPFAASELEFEAEATWLGID
jgi:hypothetical protein